MALLFEFLGRVFVEAVIWCPEWFGSRVLDAWFDGLPALVRASVFPLMGGAAGALTCLYFPSHLIASLGPRVLVVAISAGALGLLFRGSGKKARARGLDVFPGESFAGGASLVAAFSLTRALILYVHP